MSQATLAEISTCGSPATADFGAGRAAGVFGCVSVARWAVCSELGGLAGAALIAWSASMRSGASASAAVVAVVVGVAGEVAAFSESAAGDVAVEAATESGPASAEPRVVSGASSERSWSVVAGGLAVGVSRFAAVEASALKAGACVGVGRARGAAVAGVAVAGVAVAGVAVAVAGVAVAVAGVAVAGVAVAAGSSLTGILHALGLGGVALRLALGPGLATLEGVVLATAVVKAAEYAGHSG